MSNLYLDDLIGKPFVEDGKGPNGYDCYGLGQEVYNRLGKNLPDYDYSFSEHVSKDTAKAISNIVEQEKSGWLLLDKPEPYCFVVFCIVPPFVSHMGVVLEDCSRFIHVSRKNSVVIERLTSARWENRIRGYYKWQK